MDRMSLERTLEEDQNLRRIGNGTPAILVRVAANEAGQREQMTRPCSYYSFLPQQEQTSSQILAKVEMRAKTLIEMAKQQLPYQVV